MDLPEANSATGENLTTKSKVLETGAALTQVVWDQSCFDNDLRQAGLPADQTDLRTP